MIAPSESITETALAGAEIWSVDVLPRADVWAQENIALNPDYEASGGSYEIDPGWPYWREPLLMLDNREVEEITLVASTQVGKSLFVQAALLSRARIDPAPAMLAVPDWIEARKMRDRIYGNAQTSSIEVQELIPPERLWNMRELDLGTMLCHLAWSGSAQRLRGKPCKFVFCTEVDVMQFTNKAGDPINAGRQRMKQFADSKLICESTPVGEDSRVSSLYRDSDQRTWRCPCPHCGRFQELRFFTLRHGKVRGRGGIAGYKTESGYLDPDAALKEAHYICVGGCRIESHDKEWMVRNGVWVPKGCRIEDRKPQSVSRPRKKRRKLGGDGASLLGPGDQPRIVGDPERGLRHVGYHLWSIFNPKMTFGHLAASYLRHRRDFKMPDFYQNELGRRYKTPRKLPHWRRMAYRLAGDHRRGFVPPPVWFLTAGCDVQADRVFWIVRGWAPMRTSWLIDYGCFRREVRSTPGGEPFPVVNSDLAQLDTLWGRSFPLLGPNPWQQSELRVALMGVDSNYRPLDVHEYVRTKSPDDVRCVRGDDSVGVAAKFRSSVVERNESTGQPYEGGMIQWGLYVHGYKDDLAPRLLGAAHQVGSFHLLPDMPDDPLGRIYLRQMVNEEKVEKSGKHVWRMKSNRLRKDFRDCELYAAAMADMVVAEIGWGEDAWQAYLSAVLDQSQIEPTPPRPHQREDFSAR